MLWNFIKFDHEILSNNSAIIQYSDLEKILKENNNETDDLNRKEYLTRLLTFYESFLINDEICKLLEKASTEIFLYLNHKPKIKGEEFYYLKQIIGPFKIYNEIYEIKVFEVLLAVLLLNSVTSLSIHNKDELFANYSTHIIIESTVKNLINVFIIINLQQKIYININIRVLRKFIFRLICLLETKNLLESIKIIKKKTPNSFKTTKIFNLRGIETAVPVVNLNVAFIPWKIIFFEDNMYIFTFHFSSIKALFKKNYSTGEIFKFNATWDASHFITSPVHVDWDLYEILLNKMFAFYGLEKNKIADYLNLAQRELKGYDETIRKTKKSQTFSLFFYLFCLLKFNTYKNVKNIYYPVSFDFRGRIYYGSPVSPTNSKLTRYALHYDCYSELDFFEIEKYLTSTNSKTSNELKKYYYLIDDFILKTSIPININYKNTCYQGIIWLLINIGKLFKKKLKSEIYIKEFIEIGITKYFEYFEVNQNIFVGIDIEKQLEFFQIIHIIENIKKNIWLKSAINKDATASGYQHLIKILGGKSETSLKYCNLNSNDCWYDTYQILIDIFKKKYNIRWEFFDTYFNRAAAKPIIMTEAYEAVENETWKKKFLPICKEINKNISDADLIKIKEYFSLFFKFLRTENDDFFINFSDSMHNAVNTKFQKTQKWELELNDGIANLGYSKIKNTTTEVFVHEIRFTQKIIQKTDFWDFKKIKNATKANIVHSADSEIIRRLCKIIDKNIITVHDCFLIDFLNTSSFIDRLNEEMTKSSFLDDKFNGNKNKTIYSIFIVL